MPKITYIDISGKERTVEVPAGWTVMEGAVKNNIPGIDADCGGACACATCHVHVAPAWAERLSPMREDEEGLLDALPQAADTSRLSCQIIWDSDLDGLELTLVGDGA